jgi:hypothetical protein
MQMNIIPEFSQAVICNGPTLNKYQDTLKNIIETLINNVQIIIILLKRWRNAYVNKKTFFFFCKISKI